MKGGSKDSEKVARRLEREIEKQEKRITELETAIAAASTDYEELARLMLEKESADNVLLELMEQWEMAESER